MIRIAAVILMAGMILLSGCSSIKEYKWEKPSAPGTPTEQKIETTVDSQFAINAAGNATTGYIWEATFDQTYINLVSSEYIIDNPGMAGSGGINRFTFQVLKQGVTKIILVYKRPWEQTVAETAAFAIQIR